MNNKAMYKTIMEFEVRVRYSYYHAQKGSTDGRGGPKLEPDEPSYIEVDPTAHVVINNDPRKPTLHAITLTDSQIADLEATIMEDFDSTPFGDDDYNEDKDYANDAR